MFKPWDRQAVASAQDGIRRRIDKLLSGSASPQLEGIQHSLKSPRSICESNSTSLPSGVVGRPRPAVFRSSE
jgi:hypothetical protein